MVVEKLRLQLARDKHAKSACEQDATGNRRSYEWTPHYAGTRDRLEFLTRSRGKPIGVQRVRFPGLQPDHRAIYFGFHVVSRIFRTSRIDVRHSFIIERD